MKIVSIAKSKKKGTRKKTITEASLKIDHGLEGDAHAGDWHRQVSLLASESIEYMRAKGLEVTFGDFAENIATEGVDWKTNINPDSLEVITEAKLEPSLKDEAPGYNCQFERQGYICIDEFDSSPDHLVFNRTTTLRDTWARIQKQAKK